MAAKSKMERRKFLKGGMLAGAAAIVQPAAVVAQQSSAASEEVEVLTTESCGSDYMVDVIKSLGFEYVCANPEARGVVSRCSGLRRHRPRLHKMGRSAGFFNPLR